MFRKKTAREQNSGNNDALQMYLLEYDFDKKKHGIYCYVMKAEVRTCKLVSCQHYALCHQ
ncbi:MAG: hypothetical protein OIN88_02210 [Candidatus Methanoperedens sp.]|nr:hypothetical protein [Candidatus Methanoperedens sp.]MCZ7358643.1 hypothetical protein [Candidatus Methanoperedens sp.]HLB71912.1 hypothetical protein [Candidatus Methanoperedens sp.]